MNPAAAAEKKAWRQRLRQAVRGLSPEQRQAASEAVCGRIRGLPEWGRAHAVLVFSPLADEPDIREVARAALADGKRLVCPAYDAARGNYRLRVVTGDVAALAPGRYGIAEPPADAPELGGNQLDFALVPGLGFGPDGVRLGRGKGYMDRILAVVRGFKCGVAFDEQMVERLPREPHDVLLDCILTPSREWRPAPGRP